MFSTYAIEALCSLALIAIRAYLTGTPFVMIIMKLLAEFKRLCIMVVLVWIMTQDWDTQGYMHTLVTIVSYFKSTKTVDYDKFFYYVPLRFLFSLYVDAILTKKVEEGVVSITQRPFLSKWIVTVTKLAKYPYFG
jgi:hypothetical protein